MNYYHPKFDLEPASQPVDLEEAQAFRYKAFGVVNESGLDRDEYDKKFNHVIIRERKHRRVVGCFRYTYYTPGSLIQTGYSAAHYDIKTLENFDQPLMEVGRVCTDFSLKDPDILRLVWAYLAHYVERRKIGFIFGCTSFEGIDHGKYIDCFAILRERYLGPKKLLPSVKSPSVLKFSKALRPDINFKIAMLKMPPLLRAYLSMGGWVSDHAVIDYKLNTLHVFTGLEVRKIPHEKKRFLMNKP
ncbi:MAG: ornithine-acyl-ACP acyltransferase [Marinovum sp.]|mgnify:FL=1|jgi:putative hemolysin|nr:ornithine-acyl-ACP acyltransferase [Marinovum sp.]|tara:strand:- start:985 stop:1716 length:732 start_codon:yes stop_codon:yes gene_type:complete